ncbi:MAG: hypothetical protein KY391_01010 [Actinobacteria bacterium]|nr:hypothetical protein [Actinomycetota bacterium]
MNPAAPAFAIGTRVAGAVLIIGYLSGIVAGAVVSLVGALALITFGRALLLDRSGTAASGAALAVAAGALGIGALRWGTLSLSELVGAQSVLGPTIVVGPQLLALASTVALSASVVAVAAWATEPLGSDRAARVWGQLEGVLGVLAATLVFAAPGSGGSVGEFFSHPQEIAITAAVIAAGSVIVFLGPRLFGSRRVRWVALLTAGLAVAAAAALVAGSL